MKLAKHQKEAVKLISNQGMAAIFHSIGCGKTITALRAFEQLKAKEPKLKLFVICPLSLIEGAWGEEIKEHTNLRYKNLHEKRKRKQKRPPFDIYIVNYEWLLHNDLPIEQPAMIVLDESSKMKNHKSKITKKLLNMNHNFKYRVIMSGTPAPNTELEYWAQMTFLNYGIFHESFYAFKNTFFHLQRGKQVMRGQYMNRAMARDIFSKGWQVSITTQNRAELLDQMKPYCHYAKKELCFDLPEKMNEIRDIYMEPKQRALYNQMKDHCIAEIAGKDIIATVALAKIMKLRQITSGFAIDDHGDQCSLTWTGSNPKIKELLNVIEEAGDQQMIIWCQFHWEIEALKKLLPNSSVLYGKTPANKRDGEISSFKEGKTKFLIAHPASAGHGLTLVKCSLEVFFSLNYSWELYEQAKGRIHRPGQKKNCLYIHLICKESIDETIYDTLQGKAKSSDIITRFIGGE